MFVNASNNAVAKLSSNINSSQTTLTVDDASIFPDAPFLITVNEEIMRVTNVSSNTLTVQRGREGTSASSHNGGSNVENNFTAGTYQALVDEVNNLRNNSLIIEEQGKNENGEYIKYTNGRLECFQTIDLGTVSFDSRGNIYRSESFNWYYPVEFVDNDIYISITSGNLSAWVDTSANPPYKERVPFRVFSYSSSSIIIGVSLMAIGRWK